MTEFERQATVLFDNIANWETNALKRMGKRIKRYGKMSLEDLKQINNLATAKNDMNAIMQELSAVMGYDIKQTQALYTALLEEQHLKNKPLYDFRGKTFTSVAENESLSAVVNAFAKETGGNMLNLVNSKAIGTVDGNGVFNDLTKTYKQILDRAVFAHSTGAGNYNEVMKDTIKQLGGSGMRYVYESGVTRQVDTIVRSSILYGGKQVSMEYNRKIGEELGCDGIEIDYHSNPRPSHEFMQGKMYSTDGEKTIDGVTYEDATEVGVYEALADYGCLHFSTPVILGISEPALSDKQIAELDRKNARTFTIGEKEQNGYGWAQDMRRLESETRKQKNIRTIAEASGDKALVKECDEKIKACREKYNEISDVTGLHKELRRMDVYKG